MSFSTDRDLLVMEPTLFHDVALVAQTRVNVADASVSVNTLTSASADFVSAGVEPGSVVLVNDVAHEVLARVDAHTITVSLPRAGLAEPAVPGPQGADLSLVARTFRPQAALMRDALLRLVGVEPDDATQGLTEDAVVSLSVMARLEAIGTIERLYASAGVLIEPGGWRDTLLLKSDDYRRRFSAELHRATILLDTDGDGLADLRIRPGLVTLTRV